MLSLRALKHFSVLAEERHYSRAAARLHLTQSALSRSIQSLEGNLGVKLLDRTASSVSVTKAGEAVLARAHRVLAEAAGLERESRLMRGLETGDVAMGAGVFPAASFLTPLLARLAQDYPGIRMRVEIESWQSLLEMLEQDKLDFVVAVTHSLPPSSEFAIRALPPQHVGLFVRAGHPLLNVARQRLRDALADYRLAATHLPPRALAQLADIYGMPAGSDLPIALECNSVEALRTVAMHSDTVLFCMREAIADALADGRLVPLPLAYSTDAERSCNIIYHARRTLSPAAMKVVELVEPLMGVRVEPDFAGKPGR